MVACGIRSVVCCAVQLVTGPMGAVLAAPVPAAAQSPVPVHLVVGPEGNEARYRVREQLAGVDFPNDAIGTTSAIVGTLVLDANGAVVSDSSEFVVDLTTLVSDRQRRDRYIQERTLETERYPTIDFKPTEQRGLPWPLPSTGDFAFQLIGALTVHGVTRHATWDVQAQATGEGFSGAATTQFTFEDYSMERPRVAVVLSVEDQITLEYDFHLVVPSSN